MCCDLSSVFGDGHGPVIYRVPAIFRLLSSLLQKLEAGPCSGGRIRLLPACEP